MTTNKFHPPIFFLLSLVIFMQSPVSSFAQKRKIYPQNYFRWPLNIKPEIVANLGELRSNHWHMGLDIRTQQRQNLRVYAAAGGYISRVSIKKFGFGRCIVINHPNGLSTLYAHLNDFFPELEQYVEAEQYRLESWEVDLQLPREKFPVTKGQFIAYSGTTGGSQGPHVHFEIRSIETDECLNPLFFGLPLVDKVKPTLQKLAIYDRTSGIYQQPTRYFSVRNTADGYIIPKLPVIETGSEKVSFAIQAFDRISGSNNQDGIYSARLFVDEIPIVGFSLDSISYDETGFMNAHIDYRYKYNGGPYFQHLSRLPGDQGGVYHEENGNGVIHLRDTNVHHIRIELSDTYDQKVELNFAIQRKEEGINKNEIKSSALLFQPGIANHLERKDFGLFLPEEALYDSVRSFYFKDVTMNANAITGTHQVNDPSIPVHGNLVVRLKADKPILPEWKDRILIQRTYRNSEQVRKAVWENDWMSASFGDFGHFKAVVDLEPPQINDPGKGDTVDLSRVSSIVFRPTDNYDVITSFRAELNGKWLRFTNDKGRSHIYKFDKRLPFGTHTLKVRVEDLAGNVTEKTWTIKRYPYTPPKKKPVRKGGKAPVRKKTRK